MGLLEHCTECTTPPFAKVGQGRFEVPEVLNPPQSPFCKGGSQSILSMEPMV